MPIYTALLIYAVARSAVAVLAVIFGPPEHRPWSALIQGASDICCALLLRACFDQPYRAGLGWLMVPMFVFAAVWSAKVWLLIMQDLMGSGEGPGAASPAGALGGALGSGFVQLFNALWHTCFVAPSLVCAAFMLFGITEELPPR